MAAARNAARDGVDGLRREARGNDGLGRPANGVIEVAEDMDGLMRPDIHCLLDAGRRSGAPRCHCASPPFETRRFGNNWLDAAVSALFVVFALSPIYEECPSAIIVHHAAYLLLTALIVDVCFLLPARSLILLNHFTLFKTSFKPSPFRRSILREPFHVTDKNQGPSTGFPRLP
jgi:hypothetical protein